MGSRSSQKYGNEILARECWSKAMEVDPYNPYVSLTLSHLERRLKHFDTAKALLERVFHNNPTAPICVSLADLERAMGSADNARDILVIGLKTCSKEKSHILLALAWLEEDHFQNASAAAHLIRSALLEEPKNVRIYTAKASMELRQGKIDEARATLAQAADMEAEDGHHYTLWGTIELECGNYRESQRVLEEGARRYPGDKYLLQRWGSLEAKHGSFKKARDLFSRSLASQPHAPTFVAWAIMEHELGQQVCWTQDFNFR